MQQQQQLPQATPAASASPKQQQQSALMRSNVAAAAGLFSSSTAAVPSMQPWSSNSSSMLQQQLACKNSSSSNAMFPLASQNSNVQQQLMLNGYEALEFLPHSAAPSAPRLLGCDSIDSLCLTGALTNNNSSSGWSSSSSSIGCGSPTASTPTIFNSSCLLLGEGQQLLAGPSALPSAAVYRSNSNNSSIMNGSSDLAAALQQLKFVPDGPTATVVSGPAARTTAATAGMMFDYDQAAQRICSPSVGFAGGLAGDLLQPSTAAAAANALLLQQQREQLQQQQLLLAQQEQMLLLQQLQMMNLGFGGQQMMLFPN
jgi:hypothetical protein